MGDPPSKGWEQCAPAEGPLLHLCLSRWKQKVWCAQDPKAGDDVWSSVCLYRCWDEGHFMDLDRKLGCHLLERVGTLKGFQLDCLGQHVTWLSYQCLVLGVGGKVRTPEFIPDCYVHLSFQVSLTVRGMRRAWSVTKMASTEPARGTGVVGSPSAWTARGRGCCGHRQRPNSRMFSV